jgi:hypothetical protein
MFCLYYKKHPTECYNPTVEPRPAMTVAIIVKESSRYCSTQNYLKTKMARVSLSRCLDYFPATTIYIRALYDSIMKGVRIASIAATLWGLLRPVGYD